MTAPDNQAFEALQLNMLDAIEPSEDSIENPVVHRAEDRPNSPGEGSAETPPEPGLHKPLVEFLDKERRQVWALRRNTGEPFYLPEGQADELRAFAKEHLRCTHPDCDVQISTRGGMKRDGFFHVSAAQHETGRESEFHLAGKAMVTQWASTRIPLGGSVTEELTVKDPERSLLRRADVMATGAQGGQVAFEIEYKSYAVEAWRAKQDDYDRKRIACAWLIGHTKVRLAKGPSYVSGLGINAVRVPELAAQMARAGCPVMVINPVTRQIGTLADDDTFTRRFQGHETIACLRLDDIDECDFSSRGGIITPTFRAIASAEAEAARRELKEQAAGQNRVVNSWRLPDWSISPIRAAFLDRWGMVPGILAQDTGTGGGVLATLVHWHGVIYEELLHGRDEDFKWRDVFAALDRHGIRRHDNEKMTYRTLIAWLEAMERLGLLRIHRDAKRRVLLFSPAGLTLDDLGAHEPR